MAITTVKKPSHRIKIIGHSLARPLPPPVGSQEEQNETAVAVGNPAVFSVTCSTIEQVIRDRLSLIWREE
jgi:hypothetical protein